MNIPLLAIIVYLVVTTVAGLVIGRLRGKRGGVREFFIAGGGLSWYLIVPLLGAEFIGISVTVASSEMAHASGIQLFWHFIPNPIAFLVIAFLFVKVYQTISKVTLGEAVGVLFDRRTRLAYAILALGVSLITGGTGGLAIGAIVAPLLNIPYVTGVWLSQAFMVAIALTGGLRGIAWMNVIHLCAIAAGIIPAAVVSVNAVGGLGTLFASLPAEHLNLFRPGGRYIAAWVISRFLSYMATPVTIATIYAAKNERAGKIGSFTTGFLYLVFASLTALIGLSGYVLMPDIPSRLVLWAMGDYCGVTVSTLITIGVLAALVSTMPVGFLTMGGIATRDIFLRIKPDASERAQLIFNRIYIPVHVSIATLFALTQTSIIGLIVKGSQMRSIIGIVLLITVLWRRIHATAAFWTIITGGGVVAIWVLADSPFGIEPLWPGLAVGMAAMIIASLRNRPSAFRGTEGLELD